MHVISGRKLREFWAIHAEAEVPLRAWAKIANETEWERPSDIAKTYPYVSRIDKFTVFNISGNKFRLIVIAHFDRGKLFVRHVLTHEEYDRDDWKGG